MISGTVPSFLDVILNLGSSEMTSDNLLNKLRDKDRRIVFYGDNVWTKMFPHDEMFLRKSENFDSFFVNDFHEVRNFYIIRFRLQKIFFLKIWSTSNFKAP